jgi:hypothetical protein
MHRMSEEISEVYVAIRPEQQRIQKVSRALRSSDARIETNGSRYVASKVSTKCLVAVNTAATWTSSVKLLTRRTSKNTFRAASPPVFSTSVASSLETSLFKLANCFAASATAIDRCCQRIFRRLVWLLSGSNTYQSANHWTPEDANGFGEVVHCPFSSLA